VLFEKCFNLARPDLSWAVFERIRQLDPTHPALWISIVLHGQSWFTFRRRFLRFSSPTPNMTIDLRPFYWMGKSQKTWRWRCEQIPHGDALASADVTEHRKACLSAAISEFHRRREQGELSLVMRYLYVEALEIENAGDTWKTELQQIAEDHPGEVERARLTKSEIYERRQDWQNIYEILRGYDRQETPQLNALLRLSRAQRELRLGPAALFTAELTFRLYPRSALAKTALAEANFLNNMPEQAAFMLAQHGSRYFREHDVLYARALHQTERYRELERFCRAALLPTPPFDDVSPQRQVLPPAELTLIWNHAYIPPESIFEKNANVLNFNHSQSTSPFLKALIKLWLECYAQNAEGESADISRWEACGRDAQEKALLLNQLTLLLCRADKLAEAGVAAARASALFPSSAVLWRWAVSLNHEQDKVIAEARRHCPLDAELWLADLSLAVRSPDRKRVAGIVAEARGVDNSPFHAEALTRACELLFRYGNYASASTMAVLASTRAQGLLPAHLQSLRCALFDRDLERATTSVESALAASVQPPISLYRKLVELKSTDDLLTDGSMLAALKTLRSQDPNDPLWAEMLGYVRYKRGGWEVTDAVTQFMEALNIGSTNRMTYIMAAETSRLLNNHERSCDVLEKAMRRFPDDIEIINNYAFALSAIPLRSSSATNYVEILMQVAPTNIHFLDTVATVYLRAGNTSAAREALDRLLALTAQDDPTWLRAKSLEAELLAGAGKYADAIALLKASMAAGQISRAMNEDVIEMRRNLDKWAALEKEDALHRELENRKSVLTVDRDSIPAE
ncbi:MAG: hypothetical protein O3C57_03350, partial [Verrucomicrobia bacterium]|nr:hypothetical protein [Verrucomicrobiota bacterium]